MRGLLISFLFTSFISFSQSPDSLNASTFENFFGSPCTSDTMSMDIFPGDVCFLNVKESTLIRYKNGKVKWKIQLDDFCPVDEVCILLTPKSKRNSFIILFAYQNGNGVDRKVIQSRNGKVLERTDAREARD